MGRHMFEQAFRNIDDVLRKEAGCTTELDYTEQTSWLLFLKYLDGLEQDKAAEAQLEGKKHTYILDKPYRWESWAAPKGKDGKLDHNTAMTGDDLRDFVNQKLFPYLHGFTQKASGPNTIEYKIGQIFGEIRNKITSGYNLREIIDDIDELRFRSQTEKHRQQNPLASCVSSSVDSLTPRATKLMSRTILSCGPPISTSRRIFSPSTN
jgi:type I restriction enzyme M protein